MGYRMRNVTTYVKKFGSKECFNYGVDDLTEMLDDMNIQYYHEKGESSDKIEVSDEEWGKMLEEFKGKMKKDKGWKPEGETFENYTAEEIYKILKDCADERDEKMKEWGYIMLEWF